jgi:catechol 2,3-dioxygenase-like lactoylglutathione lyase family enzyme
MAADPTPEATVLEGAIRQIGYVVPDLDAAIAPWLSLGVGPWLTIREMAQPGCRYRGQPCDPTISVAFTNSGPLQLELIQPHGDTPSIYQEFLDAGLVGFHQFAWWTTDFDALLARADAAGWSAVFSGDAGGVARFAYFEPAPTVATIVEVTELNGATQGLADMLDAAVATWDGVTDPVRPLF